MGGGSGRQCRQDIVTRCVETQKNGSTEHWRDTCTVSGERAK